MMIKENDWTETTLAIAGDQGYEAAYQYLLKNRRDMEEGPTLHYYLACLACGAGRAGEARLWLGQAIVGLGYWYRPEALDDADLAPLFGQNYFRYLTGLSRLRWEMAGRLAAPDCTWRRKERDALIMALHGNGQNMAMAKADWQGLGAQAEAVQSPTPHSAGRYRWDGTDAEAGAVLAWGERVGGMGYNKVYWAGFSAGCDMLLNCLGRGLRCDGLLLQSPSVHGALQDEGLGMTLARAGAPVHIFCGEADGDCAPMARQLAQLARDAGVQVTLTMQPGLMRQFPDKLDQPYRAAVGIS